MTSNFQRIIVAKSKDDLSDLEYPCVVLVGDTTEKTKKEAIAIVMGEYYLLLKRVFNSDWIAYLPSIVLFVLGIIYLIIFTRGT